MHADCIFPRPRQITSLIGTLTVAYGSGALAGEYEDLAGHIFPGVFRMDADGALLVIERDASMPAGSYRLHIEDRITVFASERSGVSAALWSLHSLASDDGKALVIPRRRIEDAPYKELRGVHFYLPPSYGIDEFCRVLDVVSYLKYNCIFLETGGAVEFDAHPEVNAAWRKFCREARDYPGGPQGLQASEAYWKDSTHVEMANSDCLTKAELKKIADHCAMLGLEIIPEIQALSHAYYLTLAHPEIAERPYERWPDSYCPSCEESYRLYFELAEEILQVLKPARVSIGHDEVRVLGECPRCRGKSGHELLAADINRLYDFYNKRGIGVMMWGEKLQKMGGEAIEKTTDRYGRSYSMPETFRAADMIPRDIVMLDWQYSLAHDTEMEFHKKGFCQIFGNFQGSLVAEWERRSSCPNVLGAEVSTWCVPMEDEIGFNGWFEELAFSAQLLWRPDFADDRRGKFRGLTDRQLPRIREMISGKRIFDGTMQSLSELSVAKAERTEEIRFTGGTVHADVAQALLAGGLTDAGAFSVDGEADSLVFFHAVGNLPERRVMSWFFPDWGTLIPARYAVDYDDGMCVTFDVQLGRNTGAFCSSSEVVRPTMKTMSSDTIDDLKQGSEEALAPVYQNTDPWRGAAVYFTRFADFDTPDGPRTVYAYEWKNPYPGHAVTGVRVVDEPGNGLTAMLFAVGRAERKQS